MIDATATAPFFRYYFLKGNVHTVAVSARTLAEAFHVACEFSEQTASNDLFDSWECDYNPLTYADAVAGELTAYGEKLTAADSLYATVNADSRSQQAEYNGKRFKVVRKYANGAIVIRPNGKIVNLAPSEVLALSTAEVLSAEDWVAMNAARPKPQYYAEAEPAQPEGYYSGPNTQPNKALTLDNSLADFGTWFYAVNQESMKVVGRPITDLNTSAPFVRLYNQGDKPRQAFSKCYNLGGLEPWRLALPEELKQLLFTVSESRGGMENVDLTTAVREAVYLMDCFSRPGHSLQEMAENDNKRAVGIQKELAFWLKEFRNDC